MGRNGGRGGGMGYGGSANSREGGGGGGGGGDGQLTASPWLTSALSACYRFSLSCNLELLCGGGMTPHVLMNRRRKAGGPPGGWKGSSGNAAG